jgi:hypothetical protein
MSHQGYEGWFPECVVCHCGNVGPVVCLDPTCHEAHGLKTIELKPTKHIAGNLAVDEGLIEEDGHWWKCCQLCGRRIHADPGAFGSYAICVECFNQCVSQGQEPPNTPRQKGS